MFKTRLLSGIVLVIIAFLTIYSGGYVLWTTLALVSLIGLRELYQVVKCEKNPLGIAGYLAAIAYYVVLLAASGNFQLQVMVFIAALVVVMAVYVFSFPKFIRSGYDGILRDPLCGSYAVLHLPDEKSGRRTVPRGTRVPLLLGM